MQSDGNHKIRWTTETAGKSEETKLGIYPFAPQRL